MGNSCDECDQCIAFLRTFNTSLSISELARSLPMCLFHPQHTEHISPSQVF